MWPSLEKALTIYRGESSDDAKCTRLVIAWDYDQCLSKVVHGDYKEVLTSHMRSVLVNFIHDIQAPRVVLCSYSNRISNFYNKRVQPIEAGVPDNLTALGVFVENLKYDLENVDVTSHQEYMINGDAVFQQIWNQEHPGEEFVPENELKWHKTTASGTRLKENLYKEILEWTGPSGCVLFIDDKPENLEFIESTDNVKCYTLNMHATKVATYLSKGLSLDGTNPVQSIKSV